MIKRQSGDSNGRKFDPPRRIIGSTDSFHLRRMNPIASNRKLQRLAAKAWNARSIDVKLERRLETTFLQHGDRSNGDFVPFQLRMHRRQIGK